MNKLIIVTGASGGIGSGLVRRLLNDGYTNIICTYNKHPGKLLSLFDDETFDKRCYCVDLTEHESVARFRDKALSDHGTPWALINLAGKSTNDLSWKLSLCDFTDIMNVNVTSLFLVCSAFIPSMRAASNGRIINVSSVVAALGAPGASHYATSKAAVEGFTRSLALELAPKNVTANVLGLGYFDSGLIEHLSPEMKQAVIEKTPLKRLGTADDVAGLVEYLLSDESSFMTGQVLHLNGGLRV